jgi:hypothetical protein
VGVSSPGVRCAAICGQEYAASDGRDGAGAQRSKAQNPIAGERPAAAILGDCVTAGREYCRRLAGVPSFACLIPLYCTTHGARGPGNFAGRRDRAEQNAATFVPGGANRPLSCNAAEHGATRECRACARLTNGSNCQRAAGNSVTDRTISMILCILYGAANS